MDLLRPVRTVGVNVFADLKAQLLYFVIQPWQGSDIVASERQEL